MAKRDTTKEIDGLTETGNPTGVPRFPDDKAVPADYRAGSKTFYIVRDSGRFSPIDRRSSELGIVEDLSKNVHQRCECLRRPWLRTYGKRKRLEGLELQRCCEAVPGSAKSDL